MGRSSPFASASAKNVWFSAPLCGRPKEMLETPSTVFSPSSSCTIRTASSVSYAASCSAEAVSTRQSMNTLSFGMP